VKRRINLLIIFSFCLFYFQRVKENNLYELIDYIFGQIFNNLRLINLFVKKTVGQKNHIFIYFYLQRVIT
jgi:hypothetical protein